jgi:hypothetical protein
VSLSDVGSARKLLMWVSQINCRFCSFVCERLPIGRARGNAQQKSLGIFVQRISMLTQNC